MKIAKICNTDQEVLRYMGLKLTNQLTQIQCCCTTSQSIQWKKLLIDDKSKFKFEEATEISMWNNRKKSEGFINTDPQSSFS
jgi:hypothetical protein